MKGLRSEKEASTIGGSMKSMLLYVFGKAEINAKRKETIDLLDPFANMGGTRPCGGEGGGGGEPPPPSRGRGIGTRQDP